MLLRIILLINPPLLHVISPSVIAIRLYIKHLFEGNICSVIRWDGMPYYQWTW